MIIETSDNRLYRVVEINDPALAHLWYGIEVKRIKDGFVHRKNARPQAIRKACTKIISPESMVVS